MRTYLWRRLGQAVITLLGVITLIYVIQRWTSTPMFLPAQYLSFMADVLRLDFGSSLTQNAPVLGMIVSRLPHTLALAGGALLVAAGIGIPLGAALASSRRPWIARPLSWLMLAAQSMPIFWSGLLLLMVFVLTLGWLPASSAGGISQLVMPSIALGLMGLAGVARVTRDILVGKRSLEYVHTVPAAGVSIGRRLWRRGTQNVSTPIITVSWLQLPMLLTGLVVVEALIAWPGLGQLALQAALQRDFPIVRGLVLLGAMVAIGLHLVIDLLHRADVVGSATTSAGVDTLPAQHHSRPLARIGVVLPGLVLAILVIAAIFAPFIAPSDPNLQNLLGRLKPPGTTVGQVHYLLGSDELGRDLFSRLVWGGRVSLLVALVSLALSVVVGTVLGTLAAYMRGVVELVIMRLVDVFRSIPGILLALLTVAVFGPGLGTLILVLALTLWPRYARVAHAKVLLSRQHGVHPSAPMEAGTSRVHGRVLPGIVSAVLVAAMLDVGFVVLFESSLSFLGLGVPPPMPSWGAMLGQSADYMESAWWLAIFPGLCLFVLVFSSNLLADALRDPLAAPGSPADATNPAAPLRRLDP